MFIIAQLLLGSYIITRKLKIFGALLDPEKYILLGSTNGQCSPDRNPCPMCAVVSFPS